MVDGDNTFFFCFDYFKIHFRSSDLSNSEKNLSVWDLSNGKRLRHETCRSNRHWGVGEPIWVKNCKPSVSIVTGSDSKIVLFTCLIYLTPNEYNSINSYISYLCDVE